MNLGKNLIIKNGALFLLMRGIELNIFYLLLL